MEQCLTTVNTGNQIYALTQPLSFDSSVSPTDLIYITPCSSFLTPEVIWAFQFIVIWSVFFSLIYFFFQTGKRLM